MRKPRKSSYHHGNLRTALLDAALELIREQGVGAISLREVARRAGVSHAAPAHHFGDKAGLLTALAAEGFERFSAALQAGAQRGGDDAMKRFAWVGWAYVMFAAEHRAYFEVMFRPELFRREDPELVRASRGTYENLLASVRAAFGPQLSAAELEVHAMRAWSEVHGLATLWLYGNLENKPMLPSSLDLLTRKMLGLA